MTKHKIYVGTAGWSYNDWIDSFYPEKQSKKIDWLEFYSQYFNTVEVNASYYTYIAPKTVEGWIKKVEERDDFLFTIKLHQDFTHKRHFTSAQTEAVKQNLKMLDNANRLGGLLVQFPYSFSLTKDNAEHVKLLLETFGEYDKFVEVRHKSWLVPGADNKAERFFKFLAKNKSSLCTIDQPEIGEAVEFKPLAVGDNLYIRFHGRNKKAWQQSINNFSKSQTYEQQSERYDYLYSPGELLEIERVVKEVLTAVKKVFVILNNHPHGNAVANALELLHLLTERVKVNVPQTTLKAYPRLTKISLN
jgi:uncharacterized protein YecE (DUF72 family)